MKKIKIDTRYLKKNDIFLCIHNPLDDRHNYIKEAIKKKPACIIVDKDIDIKTEIPIIKVNNTNDTYYDLLNKYYDIKNINLIGVTGTDGKTTTSQIIKELLSNFSNTAYLGTNGFNINNKNIMTKNTTPSLEEIFYFIDKTKKLNGKNLVLEASSEGLLQNRCYNLNFNYAVLTNITKDHLNTHKNFENYLKSKAKLFKQTTSYNILNIDDKNYKYIKNNTNRKILTYGKNKNADFYFYDISEIDNSTVFKLKYKNKIYKIKSPLKGNFNVYNLVAAIIVVSLFDISIEDIIDKIREIKDIKGRLNFLDFNQDYKIILDYAHTINATKEVLEYIRGICKKNIITVVGCAGKRDKSKRSVIGKIVSDISDYCIFTSDDPRYEKPIDIINEMIKDIDKNNYEIIINRKKAIKEALKMARKNDYVVILGKGMDEYMAYKNKYKKYSDYKVIKNYYSL